MSLSITATLTCDECGLIIKHVEKTKTLFWPIPEALKWMRENELYLMGHNFCPACTAKRIDSAKPCPYSSGPSCA